jgi:hypothetical protein
VARGIPDLPILAAAASGGPRLVFKIGLADEGRRGDSAANNFRAKM